MGSSSRILILLTLHPASMGNHNTSCPDTIEQNVLAISNPNTTKSPRMKEKERTFL